MVRNTDKLTFSRIGAHILERELIRNASRHGAATTNEIETQSSSGRKGTPRDAEHGKVKKLDASSSNLPWACGRQQP